MPPTNNQFYVVDLGFTFKFFGKNYNQVTIYDNGYICLGKQTNCLVKTQNSEDMVIGFNYDLDTTRIESGQIYFKKLNNDFTSSTYVNLIDPLFVPKNTFMITYDNVLPSSNSDSRVSFQIFLLTDSSKSYLILKYQSCPSELTLLALSGVKYQGKVLSIANNKECISSNVKQTGVWVTDVSNYILGKY